MGLINLDSMLLKSGLNLNKCYLSFTPGPSVLPSPITMSWNVSSSGEKQYYANATLYIYASQDNKAKGADPLETRQLTIPVDASGVFAILFDSLRKEFPNNKNVPEEISDTANQSNPQSETDDSNHTDNPHSG